MSCSNSPLFIQIYHHTYQAPLFNIFFSIFFFFPPDSLKLSHLLSYFFFFFLRTHYKTGALSVLGVSEQLWNSHIKLPMGNAKWDQMHLKNNSQLTKQMNKQKTQVGYVRPPSRWMQQIMLALLE